MLVVTMTIGMNMSYLCQKKAVRLKKTIAFLAGKFIIVMAAPHCRTN